MRLFISFVVHASDGPVFRNTVLQTQMPPRSLERIADIEREIASTIQADHIAPYGRVSILHFQPI